MFKYRWQALTYSQLKWMLRNLWDTGLDRVLVAAVTSISPLTFHFCSSDESDHGKRLLLLPWKPCCRQILQFLWHCRCDCLPWLKSSWPNPVLLCICQWAVNSVLRCLPPLNVQWCTTVQSGTKMIWELQKASRGWWGKHIPVISNL